jgi:hypothetical protein
VALLTRNAKSLAVNIPLRPSSSSTTRTQSVRLAAQSWLASATVILSGTVNAWLGFKAATVPFAALAFPPFLFLEPGPCAVEMVLFLASSDSIFLRMACCSHAQRLKANKIIPVRDARYLIFLALFLTRVRVGKARENRTGMFRAWRESPLRKRHGVLVVGWNWNPGH